MTILIKMKINIVARYVIISLWPSAFVALAVVVKLSGPAGWRCPDNGTIGRVGALWQRDMAHRLSRQYGQKFGNLILFDASQQHVNASKPLILRTFRPSAP
jgi:hypothetical protein